MSVCNHTSDYEIGRPRSGRVYWPIRMEEIVILMINALIGGFTGQSDSRKLSYLWLVPINIFFCVFNPFIPKSDQCQNSLAASPEILHHTVGRTWLYTQMKDQYTTNFHCLTCTFLFKRLGECTFWTWEWIGWYSAHIVHAPSIAI